MTETIPRRRGRRLGQKTVRNFRKVCPAPDCPRNGEPFDATAQATYCSRACNLRAWRARQTKPAGDAD